MTAVRTAIVVGGGVAGPVAAAALARAGIEATVHEARASGDPGAMLTVAPNGLDALRAIGADEAVRAAGLPAGGTVVQDGRGRRIGAFGALPGLAPGVTIWREDLHRVLREAAAAHGVETITGHRLTGVDEHGDGVTARFADGTTATADVLVGADGIHSAVRRIVDPAAPAPEHVPLLNLGAVADLAVPAEPGAMHFVFGRRAFLGYWSQDDGTTAWFANLPHEAAMTLREARERPLGEWHRLLREAYAGETPGEALVAATPPEALIPLGSTELLSEVPRWHRDRLVLVGDAVHSPSPSSGQGASLAAESAVQLARCLRDAPGVAAAFAAYEGLRRERVERVAARARRVNNSKAMGPAGIAFMRLFMPIATRTFMAPERSLGLEQRHTIDFDAPVPALVSTSGSRAGRG